MTIINCEEQAEKISLESRHALSPVQQAIEDMLPKVDRLIRSFAFLNLLFISVWIVELFLLVFLGSFLIQSALFALALAIVGMTFFSYCIFRVYLQAKKPDKLQSILQSFAERCLEYSASSSEEDTHQTLASAYSLFADRLKGRESDFCRSSLRVAVLSTCFEYLSRWYIGEDVVKLREYFLQAAVREQIEVVKSNPTSLSAHAALANAYVMLSNLYQAALKANGEGSFLKEKLYRELESKFRATAQCAVEEFQILQIFAPHDPWILIQLAYSYRDLNMPLEEIQTYETLMHIAPNDIDTLFKLGVRYFQNGRNAQGLRIYEQLKQLSASRAEDLIKHYGSSRMNGAVA